MDQSLPPGVTLFFPPVRLPNFGSSRLYPITEVSCTSSSVLVAPSRFPSNLNPVDKRAFIKRGLGMPESFKFKEFIRCPIAESY